MAFTGATPELERAMQVFERTMRLNRLSFRITSVYRDPVKQKKLYDAWVRRGFTGLPAARPGYSSHEYGVAVDMLPTSGTDLETMVAVAAYAGLHWFGPKDWVHYDLYGRAWPRVAEALRSEAAAHAGYA